MKNIVVDSGIDNLSSVDNKKGVARRTRDLLTKFTRNSHVKLAAMIEGVMMMTT